MLNYEIEFEWNSRKEIENYRKHNCSFAEAVESFNDERGVQLFDTKHSVSEQRFYWIGMTSTGRIITTWFTKRGPKIRIIGCAEWRKFRRLYETSEIR